MWITKFCIGTGILLTALYSNIVTAGGMAAEVQSSAYTWVGTLSGGPVWSHGGERQTFYLAPEVERTYTADKPNNALFYGEIFAGLQKSLFGQFLGQLGLAVATTGNAELSGNIWDDADPLFNNYTYTYKIHHTHVAVKGKVLFDHWHSLLPWISGSIGAGFNRAREFQNTPIIFEAVRNPNFASHTKTAFTYTLGAGIQKALSNHVQIGIGYAFADWGKSELSRARGQTLNSGLETDHLYTNGILLNITCLA